VVVIMHHHLAYLSHSVKKYEIL